MEISAVATQQAMLQTNLSVAMVKGQAQADQAVADMVSTIAASSSGRGQELDISV